MTSTIHLPLLDSIRIASPCTERWESMCGDDRRRHCARCDLDVHNISALTREEAEGVLANLAQGRVCARFFRRADGTILTKDCPVGLAAARAKLLKSISRCAAAIGLGVLSAAAAKAAQDKSWGNYGWSLRLNNIAPVQWMSFHIQTGIGRIFPGRFGRGGAMMGDIAGPPGTPPPVQGVGGSPFGPHEWEYQQ
jgi:hypothetical protein